VVDATPARRCELALDFTEAVGQPPRFFPKVGEASVARIMAAGRRQGMQVDALSALATRRG
jgi:hypothetical protein